MMLVTGTLDITLGGRDCASAGSLWPCVRRSSKSSKLPFGRRLESSLCDSSGYLMPQAALPLAFSGCCRFTTLHILGESLVVGIILGHRKRLTAMGIVCKLSTKIQTLQTGNLQNNFWPPN